MNPGILNVTMREASNFIDSIFQSESKRTGFQFSCNRKGAVDIDLQLAGISPVSVPIINLDKMYERAVWELLKTIPAVSEELNPRRLIYGNHVIATHYAKTTVYPIELLAGIPSDQTNVKEGVASINGMMINVDTISSFYAWVMKVLSHKIEYSDTAVTVPVPNVRYIGIRGTELFIVTYYDDLYYIFKENGREVSAKRLYDIELREPLLSTAELPIEILAWKIRKEVISNG